MARRAVMETARDIRQQGRGQVRATSRKFTVTTKVSRERGGFRIAVNLIPHFGKVFEYGGVSRGQPLLWFGVAFDSKGIPASRYPGRLVRLTSRKNGRQVLINARSRQIKYISVEQVNFRPQWNIRKIALHEAERLVQRLKEMANA